MKPAVWSRVCAAIRQRYPRLSWQQAKQVYDHWKEKFGRTPSLRMVQSAPARPPRLKAFQTPPPKPAAPPKAARKGNAAPSSPKPSASEMRGLAMPARRPRPAELPRPPVKPAPPPAKLPPGLHPPPPAPERLPSTPRPISGRKPRSQFQRFLAERELPIELGKHATGAAVSALWRFPEQQEQVADALMYCYNSVVLIGYIPQELRDNLYETLSMAWAVMPDDAPDPEDMMWQWLRECYSTNGGKK